MKTLKVTIELDIEVAATDRYTAESIAADINDGLARATSLANVCWSIGDYNACGVTNVTFIESVDV